MNSGALKICQCGFANRPSANTCVACGVELVSDDQGLPASTETLPPNSAQQLILTNAAYMSAGSNCSPSEVQVVIPAPGGIIGRAGDFSPEVFSARVSGIHAKVIFENNIWSIEFLGRNKSYILRAGEWIHPANGTPVNLMEGDQLRLADMLFAVSMNDGCLVDDVYSSAETAASSIEQPVVACDEASEFDSDSAHETTREAWVIVCPICGQRYEVEDAASRIKQCSVCSDVIDKRAIACALPKLQSVQFGASPSLRNE